MQKFRWLKLLIIINPNPFTYYLQSSGMIHYFTWSFNISKDWQVLSYLGWREVKWNFPSHTHSRQLCIDAHFGLLISNLGLFHFHCLWSWIKDVWQCVVRIAGVVSMTKKIKMRLMRSQLGLQGGLPAVLGGQVAKEKNVALTAKAGQHLGRDEKRNWIQSSAANIIECRDKAATSWT